MDQAARDLRRRLRAARELAGYESMEDLIAQIGDERGFGKSTLYAIEQGREKPGVSKLMRIAEACGLDPAWFYVDIAAAIENEARGLPLSELARQLQARQQAREDPAPPDSAVAEDDPPGSHG